jgi:hypothetical protein
MKKITFVLFLASVVAFAMILGACNDSSDNSSSADNSVNSSSAVSSGNNSENVSNSADNDASNGDSSESGANASDGVSDVTDESDNSDVVDNSDEDNTSNGSENSDESDESDNNGASDDSTVPDDSSDESFEPEVVGSGTEADPYLVIPNEDMHVVTVNIPAGKDVYYNIYRVGGMNLKIKSKDVYIIYDGKTYNPKSGTLSLSIEDAMASEAISFRIGNNASSEQSFELVFSNPTGSYMNPTKVDDLKDEKFIEIEADNAVGHYYKYVAEKKGTIVFAMSATADSTLSVTNNRNSAQRTTEADGSADGDVKYVEIEVEKGDELIINVGALPNRRGKYPATDITWSAEYK